ncbi:MAG: hypothetical protein ACD_54C00531G0001, partial [uncultured bacterium]
MIGGLIAGNAGGLHGRVAVGWGG